MRVCDFRSIMDGPEFEMEKILRPNLSQITSVKPKSWVAGSLRIGAGMPDLTIVSYKPDVLAFANVNIEETKILSYLKIVGRAKSETIAKRVGLSEKKAQYKLTSLLDLELVNQETNVFKLSHKSRNVINEITTIEVKVQDWKKAIQQASRNKIFANRSYIAMPLKLAKNLKNNNFVKENGLGLIGIDNNEKIIEIKKARSDKTKVWSYYYLIARELAREKS